MGSIRMSPAAPRVLGLCLLERPSEEGMETGNEASRASEQGGQHWEKVHGLCGDKRGETRLGRQRNGLEGRGCSFALTGSVA